MGMISFLKRMFPEDHELVEPQPLRVWEDNPAFGKPFLYAVNDCKTTDELIDVVANYQMTSEELDEFEEAMEKLVARDSLIEYANEVAKPEAIRITDLIYGRDHPAYDYHYETKLLELIELEALSRDSIAGAVALAQRKQIEDFDSTLAKDRLQTNAAVDFATAHPIETLIGAAAIVKGIKAI